MTEHRKQQLHDAFEIVKTIAETIRELREIPSGHLYAMLMPQLELHEYEQVIGILKNAGLITVTPAHLLQWQEPQPTAQ